MPARLKSFELTGYKTFATRTEFQFADGVTAIVGPNGSGKSNIADALRWVLGEQSYGLLRGKKTEDMIFSGSEQRSRAGMAQATVVFDNGDGWLPIDFSEVAITRRAYRDGDNEYLLNGQRVRLKDVTELLAKSGLAERTYTIIGQGLVDAALALKAEERRRLFEEAAGIGLYRARREESLRRLEATRRNLERVQDILAELQPRLRSLERQTKRVQEYEQIRTDLHVALKEYYGYHWHQAQAEYGDALNAARKHEEALQAAQQVQVLVDEEIGVIRQKLQTLHLELSEGRKNLADFQLKRELIARNRAVGQEKMRSLSQQRDENEKVSARRKETLVLLEQRKQLAETEVEQLSTEVSEYKTQLKAAEQAHLNHQTEQAGIELQVKEARSKLSDLTGRQAYLHARLEEKKLFRSRQLVSIDTITATIEKIRAEHDACTNTIEDIKLNLQDADERLSEQESQYCDIQGKYEDVDREAKRIQKEMDGLENYLSRLRTEAEILEQADRTLSGYAEGSQYLLQKLVNRDDNHLLGAVGTRLLVPADYEVAIAAALGEYVDGVVFSSSQLVDASLDLLREKTARGAIFPLDNLKPAKLLRIEVSKLPGDGNSILGVAADLIKYPAEYRKVIELLLGQVIVVKDRVIARNVLDSGKWHALPGLRVVTLKGELFSVNGMIAVGSSAVGIISRPRQIRENKENIATQEYSFLQLEAQLQKTKESLNSLEDRLALQGIDLESAQAVVKKYKSELTSNELSEENLRANLAWHQNQIEKLQNEVHLDAKNEQLLQTEAEQLNTQVSDARSNLEQHLLRLKDLGEGETKDQLAYWKTRMAVSEQASNDARRRCQERISDIEIRQKENDANQLRIEKMAIEQSVITAEQEEMQQQEQVIADEIEHLRSKLDPLDAEANQLESEQNNILGKDAQARQRFRTAEHYHTQAKINLARRQEILDSLRRRIEDDFGLVSFDYEDSVTGPKPLPIDGMVETLPYIKELSLETEESIQRQRTQLKRIGPVNFEAQSEYNEVRDRYQFMIDQVTDLQKAERDIQEVIAELDILMKREFRKTFDAVALEFRSIFTRLFNGGMARLVLTDPESIADTGIDIEARLPGRREQGLSLLSGGERSLTAVALVFSLLKISPTPFCILDEVDAMLDEANVGRFREMLTELSEKTQFIVITHNRNTVQAAGVIYGVTMGRDSASQVISLKLDDVNDDYGV